MIRKKLKHDLCQTVSDADIRLTETVKKIDFVNTLYEIVEDVKDKTEEKELKFIVNKAFDEIDTDQTGELGYAKRVEICELLKERLSLEGSPFDLSAKLLKEGDTDGNLLISRDELIGWAIEKRYEVCGKPPVPYVAINETEEELIERVSKIFDKCDIDKSGALRNVERIDLVKALQAELDLNKNPWAAQTQLRIEADTDGDM